MIRTFFAAVKVAFFEAYFCVFRGISMDYLSPGIFSQGAGKVIDRFYPRSITQRCFIGNRRSMFFRIMVGLSILGGGNYSAQSAEIDSLTWKRAFTNFCLQEAYSKPNAVEALYFVGQTANAVCGCGGELMGATLTAAEIEFYSANQRMRGDTKMRWRKGLVQCLKRNLVPGATTNDSKVAVSSTIN